MNQNYQSINQDAQGMKCRRTIINMQYRHH